MTQEKSFKLSHNTYGGKIYLSDFTTEYASNQDSKPVSNIANRIILDWCFDSKCRENIRNREKEKNFE